MEQAIKRFFQDWQKFGLMGLGALIVNAVAGIIGGVIALVLMGPAVMSAVRADMMGYGAEPGIILAVIGSSIGVVIAALVVGAVGFGLTSAGVMGCIAGYRRGEEVSLGLFWTYATRYMGRMILLALLGGLISLVSLVLALIPILGWLLLVVWMPTSAVVLFFFPAYLIVNDEMGAIEALGAGFRVLTGAIGEALIGGLIVLVAGAVFSVIALIPLIGWIAVGIFAQPLLSYLLVERFESAVRPRLSV